MANWGISIFGSVNNMINRRYDQDPKMEVLYFYKAMFSEDIPLHRPEI